MEKEIEESLKCPNVNSQSELKLFVKKMQSKTAKFEQQLYENGISDDSISKIKKWRRRIIEIINENKELPEENIETEKEKAGIDTLKLLNRQLNLADTNQMILQKSTLKLIGLDYSTSEIENQISKTKKNFENSMQKELQERKNLIKAFVLFIIICIIIIADKMGRYFRG